MSDKPPILLVIDLQHGIVEPRPEAGPRSTPDLTINVPKVLQAWRKLGWPIIHIVHHDSDPDHPLNKDIHPKGHKSHVCAAPQTDEPVLLKTAGSAFTDPELRLFDRLNELGGAKAKVVIVGMDGAQCVNDNARGGSDRGFDMTVVADACASFGMSDYRPGGKEISAEDTHVAAMSILANGFAKVVTTNDLLQQISTTA